MNNEDPTIKLYVQNDTKNVEFFLNYSAIVANNNFSVFLDGRKIADCNAADRNVHTSCEFSSMGITKGEHEMIFKSGLPARTYGNSDPRSLGYDFSNITVVSNNGEII